MYPHLQALAQKARQKAFRVGPYAIVSQDPTALKTNFDSTVISYLPQFIALWRDIERATGHRWKCTSYIRNSPSHRMGHAFDLAPDIAPNSQQYYAVYNNSDPVLYKREKLILDLQKLRSRDYSNGMNKIGIFLEPDHLHVQVLAPNGGGNYPVNIVKWKIAKPIYPDTYQRMELPVIR